MHCPYRCPRLRSSAHDHRQRSSTLATRHRRLAMARSPERSRPVCGCRSNRSRTTRSGQPSGSHPPASGSARASRRRPHGIRPRPAPKWFEYRCASPSVMHEIAHSRPWLRHHCGQQALGWRMLNGTAELKMLHRALWAPPDTELAFPRPNAREHENRLWHAQRHLPAKGSPHRLASA